jgi:hypothetical protein|tara:strand:- start:26 stop:274 length:249 start_codon:yes stop_codon:yes gene_type:complete
MPLTKKGKKIMKSMKKQYGDKEGEAVFYASANKGKIKKVHSKKEGGAMEPYYGSFISGTVDGKKLSNPSYKKYYGNLLRGFK